MREDIYYFLPLRSRRRLSVRLAYAFWLAVPWFKLVAVGVTVAALWWLVISLIFSATP